MYKVVGTHLLVNTLESENNLISKLKLLLFKSYIIKQFLFKYRLFFCQYFTSSGMNKMIEFHFQNKIYDYKYLNKILNTTFDILEKINTIVKENNIKLIIFRFSSISCFVKNNVIKIDKKENYVKNQFETFCKNESITCINLHKLFIEKSHSKSMILPIDKHLNAFGHKIVGDFLFKKFLLYENTKLKNGT